MPTLYDREGNAHQIGEADYQDALLSGQYSLPKGTNVPVRFENGQLGNVAVEDFGRAIGAGARFAQSEEIRQHNLQEDYGGLGGQALAVGAGAARGLTFGLSDVVGNAAGIGEDLRNLQEANPVSSLVGEVGSIALGGAGALKAAGAVPRAIELAGLGAGKVVAKGIAKKGLGDVAAMATRGLIDGLAYGTSATISEAALANKPLTAEEIVSQIGASTLLGGAAGGALGVLGKGVGAVGKMSLRKSKELAAFTASKAEQMLGQELTPGTRRAMDVLIDGYAKGAAAVTGGSADDIARLMKDKGARAAVASGLDGFEPKVRRFVDEFKRTEDMIENAMDNARGMAKKIKINKLVDDTKRADVYKSAEGMLDRMRLELKDAVARGKKSRVEFTQMNDAKNVLSKVESVSSMMRANKVTAADVFNELDDLKRLVGKAARKSGWNDPDGGGSVQFFEDLYMNRLMPHLEDANLYGKGAALQKEVNPLWTNYLKRSKQFRQKFMMDVGEKEAFQGKDYVIDSGKVNVLFKNWTDVGNDTLRNEVFRPHMQARAELLEGFTKAYNLGDDATMKAARESSAGFQKLLGDVEELATTHSQLKSIAKDNQLIGAPLSLGALGGMAFGAPGAVAGAAIGKAFQMLSRPEQMIRNIAFIEKVAGKTKLSIGGSLDKFIEVQSKAARAGARGAARAARIVPAAAALQEANYGEPARHASRSKPTRREAPADIALARAQEIIDLTQQPEKMLERISSALTPIAAEAPELSAHVAGVAARAASFLSSKAPKNPYLNLPGHPAAKKWKPSPVQVAKFARYIHAVEKPTSVIEDLADGYVSAEGAEVLRTVYPELFGQVQQGIVDRLTSLQGSLPYDARLRLSRQFDVPIEPLAKQDTFRIAQQAFTQEEAQRGAQGQGGGGVRVTGIEKAAKGATRSLTSAQKLESNL